MENLRQDIDKSIDQSKLLTEKIGLKLLDIEVHDRKRSIEISGIAGDRNESSDITRRKIVDLNYAVFSTTYMPQITACHRLSPEPGSNIILVFLDLDDKNHWMYNAYRLKNYNQENKSKIYINQSLPPAVKGINKVLRVQRAALPEEDRRKSSIRNLAHWPYQLIKFTNGKDPIYPKISKDEVIKKLIN